MFDCTTDLDNVAFSSSSLFVPDSLLYFPRNRKRHHEFTRRLALPEMNKKPPNGAVKSWTPQSRVPPTKPATQRRRNRGKKRWECSGSVSAQARDCVTAVVFRPHVVWILLRSAVIVRLNQPIIRINMNSGHRNAKIPLSKLRPHPCAVSFPAPSAAIPSAVLCSRGRR